MLSCPSCGQTISVEAYQRDNAKMTIADALGKKSTTFLTGFKVEDGKLSVDLLVSHVKEPAELGS